MSLYSVKVYNKDLSFFTYPEISQAELHNEFENLKQLCGEGIDFIHKEDIIELKTIIVESDRINLYFQSLGALLLNSNKRITNLWRLIHFKEAIQDREIFPLKFVDDDNINQNIVKIILLM